MSDGKATTKPRILIAEDEFIIASELKLELTQLGYAICGPVSSGEAAVKLAEQERPDLILMDIILKGQMDGIEAAERIRSSFGIPVVFLTAYTDRERLDRAKLSLPFGYVLKPFQIQDLKITLEMALYMARIDAERRRSEEALTGERDRIQQYLDVAGVIMAVIDANQMVRVINRKGCEILGYSQGDIIGANWFDRFIRAEEKEATKSVFNRLMAGEIEPVEYYENAVVTRSGEERLIAWHNTIVRDASGNISGTLSSGEDITERKRAEEALRWSEERYRLLVENAPLGIISIDRQGRIEKVNAKLLEILNPPSVEAMRTINMFTFSPLVEAGISANFRRCMETGQAGVFETPYVTKWGDVFLRYHLTPVLDGAGRPVGAQGIVEDISVSKRLEAELRQAQKMEAIGTLAGGIAHDFNNILSAMLGYSELASLQLPQDHPTRSHLEQVSKAGLRAKHLVQQILTFSRKTQEERKPINIVPIIKEGLKFLRASLPSTIEIKHQIENTPCMVLADPTQIHQILMNLCANASQAMSNNGGILEVNLSAIDLGSENTELFPDLEPAPYFLLTVGDTGKGMTAEVMDRIFEPFFTTKESGQGTGLGLAVVHGIVKNHDGAVRVQSQRGMGTKFHVLLPKVEGADQHHREFASPIPYGKERILFIDDEELLVDLGKQMLEVLGYHVLAETSPLDALETFRKAPEAFDLVITDMTMPKMTGYTLAKEIMGIQPDIPIILCTGFSESMSEEEAKAGGIKEFIMKPLAIIDLAKTIRKTLDRD